MDELIQAAKSYVEEAYRPVAGEWLRSELTVTARGKSHLVELFVLEGSPPGGYVLASHGAGVVVAIEKNFNRYQSFVLE